MRTKHPRAATLRRMLEMLVEHRREPTIPAKPESDELVVVSLADLPPPKPRWASHIEHAKEDAVEAALYAVIREEGWAAFAAGGLDGMHALSDDATGDDLHLASILDHRWDGIGANDRGVWVT